jgi:hypothetical protein
MVPLTLPPAAKYSWPPLDTVVPLAEAPDSTISWPPDRIVPVVVAKSY